MAVPAPASVTVGDVIRGSEVNITWSAVPDAVAYRVQRSVNGMSFGDEIINNTTLTSMTDVAGENWNTVQYRVQAMAYAGAMLGYSDWTVSEVKTAVAFTPPTPDTGGGHLEQFQNSAGEDIYPRTIVEGIYRKSDGKSLLEVLEEIETTPGPPGPAGTDGKDGKDGQDGAPGKDGVGVPAGGKKGQVLVKKSNADFDTGWEDPPGGESGGEVSLENVVTIEGGAVLEIEGDFGSAPYTIKITDGEASGGTEGGDSPAVPDQPEWVETILPLSAGWMSVAYGDGKFVAVTGGGNNAAYSTNGINWYVATMPSSANWWGVAYGDGKFVAVAYQSNKATYSTDGITWTTATLPAYGNWWGVAYGDGKFVAVAYQSSKAAYSADGITWYAAAMPAYGNWWGVAYGNGKFVAPAFNSNKAAYSTDGISWSETTMPSSAKWKSVCYGDGKFVAVADENKAAYSMDGITWTATTLPSTSDWYGVAYGNGKFVTVGIGENKAAYSADGITWTAATLPYLENWHSVAYGGGKFVVVAGFNSNKAAYSTDGVNWKKTTLPSSVDWTSVTYGGGKFVTVADGTNKAAYYIPGNTSDNAPDNTPGNASKTGIGVYVNGKKVAGIGEPGPQGQSAYEVAVANGFEGTESEWLASLKGPPGPAGANGADGATGPTGPAGPGVPTGGTAGQVLTKQSSTNYDTGWKTLVTYGTSDLTAGSSSLATGQMYLVYE